MHIQGYFRNQLNTRQRGELRDVILHYRNGQLPILAPITLLKHYGRIPRPVSDDAKLL